MDLKNMCTCGLCLCMLFKAYTICFHLVFVETIVGVNKYKLLKEDEVDVLIVDNSKVRESQVGSE